MERKKEAEKCRSLLHKSDCIQITDACRLIYDLLEPVFGLKPGENKYMTYLEEKVGSEIGSQGNVK